MSDCNYGRIGHIYLQLLAISINATEQQPRNMDRVQERKLTARQNLTISHESQITTYTSPFTSTQRREKETSNY